MYLNTRIITPKTNALLLYSFYLINTLSEQDYSHYIINRWLTYLLIRLFIIWVHILTYFILLLLYCFYFMLVVSKCKQTRISCFLKITWDSPNAFKIYNNIYTNFNCITLLILFENCYKYLLIKNKIFITSLEFIIIKILNPANVYKAAHTNAHWTRQNLDRQCIGLDRNAHLLHFLLYYLFFLQFSLLLFYFALANHW